MNLIKSSIYRLRNRASGEFFVKHSDSDPQTSREEAAAKLFHGDYLNDTCWDWDLGWDAVEV